MKKSVIVFLVVVFFVATATTEVLACYHPVVIALHRPKTVCFGFVRHFVRVRGVDNILRYRIVEVLEELPCPPKK